MSYFKDPTRVPQGVRSFKITRALQQNHYPFATATSLENTAILQIKSVSADADNVTAVLKSTDTKDVMFADHQIENGTVIPVMFIGKIVSTLIQNRPGWYFFVYEIRTVEQRMYTINTPPLYEHHMLDINSWEAVYFEPRDVAVQQHELIVDNAAQTWHFIVAPLLISVIVSFCTTTWHVETSIALECTWNDVQMVLMEVFVLWMLDKTHTLTHGMDNVPLDIAMLHEVVFAVVMTVCTIGMNLYAPDTLLFLMIIWEHAQTWVPSMWFHVMCWLLL